MIEPIRNGILSVEGAADNVEEEMLNIERENCMSMGMNDKDSCSTVRIFMLLPLSLQLNPKTMGCLFPYFHKSKYFKHLKFLCSQVLWKVKCEIIEDLLIFFMTAWIPVLNDPLFFFDPIEIINFIWFARFVLYLGVNHIKIYICLNLTKRVKLSQYWDRAMKYNYIEKKNT